MDVDAQQHIGQVGVRIDVVEPAGGDLVGVVGDRHQVVELVAHFHFLLVLAGGVHPRGDREAIVGDGVGAAVGVHRLGGAAQGVVGEAKRKT